MLFEIYIYLAGFWHFLEFSFSICLVTFMVSNMDHYCPSL